MTSFPNGSTSHDSDWDDETTGESEDSGQLPGLPSLTEGQFSLSGGGSGGMDEAELWRRLSFSGNIAAERQITFDYYIDFVSDSHLELPEEREAMEGLLDHFWWVFSADCTNREGRIEFLESQCSYWIGRMAAKEEQEAADAMLNQWAAEFGKQLNLKVRNARFGFQAIDNDADYEVWKKAETAMAEIDSKATELSAAAYSYNLTRIRQLRVQEERVMDEANGVTEVDFTALKKLIRRTKDIKGKDILHVMPWPFQRAFNRGRSSKSDGIFDARHMEAMMAGVLAQSSGAGFNRAPLVSIGTAGEPPPPTPGGEKKDD